MALWEGEPGGMLWMEKCLILASNKRESVQVRMEEFVREGTIEPSFVVPVATIAHA